MGRYGPVVQSDLRPYRRKSAVTGQSSPAGLIHTAVTKVVGGAVADIGCGAGVLGYLLRAAWEFTEAAERDGVLAPGRLIGVDWSPSTIAVLSRHSPYDELLQATSGTLPLPDKAVDTAISTENLEHLLPAEAVAALAEMARVSRRRIVISTPAPWEVVNVGFLTDEIRQAESDPHPMGYGEYLNLVGRLHKSSVAPEQMRAAGFTFASNRAGAPMVEFGSIIYTADPSEVDASKIGPVVGVDWDEYPTDDGRGDWRAAYLAALRASLAMSTPRKPPLGVRFSPAAKALREALRR